MLVHLLGDDELGADAVDGTHDDGGVRVASQRQVHLSAETADDGVRSRPAGACDCGLDPLDQLVSGVDAHAGISIRQRLLCSRGSLPERTMGDVLSKVHAFELDQTDTLVGPVDRGSQACFR